ncbi:Subtilase family protein [Dyadobacter koreensis]|uniref:Subtilase family protein n=1 Tax=Dyadobacter koreensis TaxID=408657 RepID=A0A1H6WV35_9BACT|nr:S8 family peptidase [Dyadobacter koreensis]SEJ16630.1 Subtilase family protein [Dyadobacter koreensis]
MEQFAHLRLIAKQTGIAAIPGGGQEAEETRANKADRQSHSGKLQRWLTDTKTSWENEFKEREKNNLAPLDKDVVTVLFQINPDLLLPTFDLESFGIEIISEEDDGFIIGAAFDNFRSLEEKIDDFVAAKRGSAKIGDLWKIIDGDRNLWRAEHILSEDLFARWGDIQDDDQFKLEVSVAFAKPLGARPDSSKRGGDFRLEEYSKKLEERDEALMQREAHFDSFISFYGSRQSDIVGLDDSFCAQVEISGKGLKDLVENYPFVFEVIEIEDTSIGDTAGQEVVLNDIEILPPSDNAPIVGIIDSGIMEGHRYLASAIDAERSISYLVNNPSTADHVIDGGHGTKVAGAVLYPKGLSILTVPYSPPCFVRNLRILNDNNNLEEKYPAELMQRIVDDNGDCSLYNLSVNSTRPFRLKHMSSWAATIDKLTHQNNVLFILSAGNVPFPSLREYLRTNRNYPAYLENPFCRIANPAQSSFCISVGSIDHVDFDNQDWGSLGGNDKVSGYSRIGSGIWGQIKPDLVEYGGGIVVSKNGLMQVVSNVDTATELVHSTLHGGSAIGKSAVGTSYSAPKVTHIAAVLKGLYPDEGINLIRALLVQGARLPNELFHSPTLLGIRQLGYGVPSIDRVTRNTDYRATFYSTNNIAANEGHLYSLKLPESLRDPGNEYDVLIEVTLAYTAKVRRTRQRLKSYLATWLDWTSSKLDERFNAFSERALKPDDGSRRERAQNEGGQAIQWKIRERSDLGEVLEINRNQGSLQKDWVILKSYQLREELSFAIRGHKGWDKDFEKIPYAFTVSIEVLGAEIPIYEEIRIENEVEVENEIRIK